MKLPFLDRDRELARIARALGRPAGSLVAIYGRRRLGKSRLLRKVITGLPATYFVGDERDAPLQREALAREAAALLRGFDSVVYPTWEALLRRWWDEAPAGAVLALDEFPWLVATAPELPNLIQKLVDEEREPARHLILCGSSQRMMQGLLLDASAPLYGRAVELIRIQPLSPSWLGTALSGGDDLDVVEHYAVYGGVPRYWELALDFEDLWSGIADLILDPLGILHREPQQILMDDLREAARASSILALVGQGCHRMSEIAGRLGQPSTNLTRPVARLLDLGLLDRETPWGTTTRNTKRTLYRVADPLLRFWFRHVDPNRTRLEAGQIDGVLARVREDWPRFLGMVWEDLVRQSIARRPVLGESWLPAARWWGAGTHRRPLEIDVVAGHVDSPSRVLVGEVKVTATPADVERILTGLTRKAETCPALRGREITVALWVLQPPGALDDPRVLTARDVVG